jgi:hypothetical protein
MKAKALALSIAETAGKLILLFAVATIWVESRALADGVPTHGALGPWLDPFIPGWPVPPAFPPPGPGVVVPGDGVPVDPEYNVLGAFAFDSQPGFDAAVSPGGWHWESELDLDPYPVGGVVGVRFDFTMLGGAVFGPIPVPLLPGPDIYLDVDQPDQVPGDMGPFAKAIFNLTPFVIAWGTSVTEDPAGPVIRKVGVGFPPGGPAPFGFFFHGGGPPRLILDYDGSDYSVVFTPEPSTLVLSLVSVSLLGFTRYKQRITNSAP